MYIQSIALTIHYLLDVVLVKFLSDNYNFKKIMVNGFLLTFILLIIFFPKEIILKPDFNYLLLIFFSLNILFGMYIWYNAIKNKFELGKLEGIAIAIYLPLLTIGSAIFFKQKIKFSNLIGILLISIGSYFTLS